MIKCVLFDSGELRFFSEGFIQFFYIKYEFFCYNVLLIRMM